jgi:hypothetical protein
MGAGGKVNPDVTTYVCGVCVEVQGYAAVQYRALCVAQAYCCFVRGCQWVGLACLLHLLPVCVLYNAQGQQHRLCWGCGQQCALRAIWAHNLPTGRPPSLL